MGLATLLGGRAQGFFTPYRYAAQVTPPGLYPAIEAAFRDAEPAFPQVLDDIDTHGERLSGFNGPPPEPRWGQSWFPRLDGAAAYALVRRHKPKQIVEVGSGHSTRMLARAALDAGENTQITCIDPAPRAALKGFARDYDSTDQRLVGRVGAWPDAVPEGFAEQDERSDGEPGKDQPLGPLRRFEAGEADEPDRKQSRCEIVNRLETVKCPDSRSAFTESGICFVQACGNQRVRWGSR